MKLYNARIYDRNDNLLSNTVVDIDKNGVIKSVKQNAHPKIKEGDFDCADLVLVPSYMDCAVTLPGKEFFKLCGTDLSECNTTEAYLQQISQYIGKTGLRGFGYNQYILGAEGTKRIKALMDTLYPETPCYIYADDLTCMIVNNAMLERAKDAFVVDSSMHETGLLNLHEIHLLRNNTDVLDLSDGELSLACMAFQAEMLSHGITAIRAIDCFGDISTIKVISDLDSKGLWALQTVINVPVYPFDTQQTMVERYEEYRKYNSKTIHVTGISITLDGSIDTMQAALTQPYEGTTWSGDVMWSKYKLHDTVEMVCSQGIDVNINAYGDRAVSEAVEVLSATKDTYATGCKIVTHAYLMSQFDMEMCVANNVTVCVEPPAVPYENTFYEGDKDALGARVYAQYPVGRLICKGVNILAGSNTPTQPDTSPISGVYKATHRTSVDDATAYHVTQGYKNNALRVFGMSNLYGDVVAGLCAALVLVDKDIVKMREDLLCDAKYMATVIGNNVIWESADLAELRLQQKDRSESEVAATREE